MNSYIYPQNLKAQAKLWLWNLKDLCVIGVAVLISVFSLSQIKFPVPLAITLVYAFLTVRLDDMSVLDYIKRAVKFFITTQQYFIWRAR